MAWNGEWRHLAFFQRWSLVLVKLGDCFPSLSFHILYGLALGIPHVETVHAALHGDIQCSLEHKLGFTM
jgi:hypothetical protein